MRILSEVVIWHDIGRWEENALFTFPNVPPVPFVTTGSSLNSADLQSRMSKYPQLSLTSATVMSITSSEKNQAFYAPISSLSASKTYMSRASEA